MSYLHIKRVNGNEQRSLENIVDKFAQNHPSELQHQYNYSRASQRNLKISSFCCIPRTREDFEDFGVTKRQHHQRRTMTISFDIHNIKRTFLHIAQHFPTKN